MHELIPVLDVLLVFTSLPRVPLCGIQPPCVAIIALLPWEHVTLNAAHLERWGWNGGMKVSCRDHSFFRWRFSSSSWSLCTRGKKKESFLLNVPTFLPWGLPVFGDVKKREFIHALHNIQNGELQTWWVIWLQERCWEQVPQGIWHGFR